MLYFFLGGGHLIAFNSKGLLYVVFSYYSILVFMYKIDFFSDDFTDAFLQEYVNIWNILEEAVNALDNAYGLFKDLP